jgi:glycerol dehydrogenase-like iron-containing ADH family enzyme
VRVGDAAVAAASSGAAAATKAQPAAPAGDKSQTAPAAAPPRGCLGRCAPAAKAAPTQGQKGSPGGTAAQAKHVPKQAPAAAAKGDGRAAPKNNGRAAPKNDGPAPLKPNPSTPAVRPLVPDMDALVRKTLKPELTVKGSPWEGQAQLWTGESREGQRWAYLVTRSNSYALGQTSKQDVDAAKHWVAKYGPENKGRAKGDFLNSFAEDKAPLYHKARELLGDKRLQGRSFPEGYVEVRLPATLGADGSNLRMLAIASSMGFQPELAADARTPSEHGRTLLLPNNSHGGKALFGMYNTGGTQSQLAQTTQQGVRPEFNVREHGVTLEYDVPSTAGAPRSRAAMPLHEGRAAESFVEGFRSAKDVDFWSNAYVIGQSVTLLASARALPRYVANSVQGQPSRIVHTVPFSGGSNILGGASQLRQIVRQANQNAVPPGVARGQVPVSASRPSTTLRPRTASSPLSDGTPASATPGSAQTRDPQLGALKNRGKALLKDIDLQNGNPHIPVIERIGKAGSGEDLVAIRLALQDTPLATDKGITGAIRNADKALVHGGNLPKSFAMLGGPSASGQEPDGLSTADRVLTAWHGDTYRTPLAGVLTGQPDLTREIDHLQTAGWRFGWGPVGSPRARVLNDAKQVLINPRYGAATAWPKALETVLRDGVLKAQIQQSGVENDVSWLVRERGRLDQTRIETRLELPEFDPSVFTPDTDAIRRAVIEQHLQDQIEVHGDGESQLITQPRVEVQRLDSSSTVRDDLGANVRLFVVEVGPHGRSHHYLAKAVRAGYSRGADGLLPVDFRLDASDRFGATHVPKASVGVYTGLPTNRDELGNVEVPLGESALRDKLRVALMRAFPNRAEEIRDAQLEPKSSSANREVPTNPIWNADGAGPSWAESRTTARVPAVDWWLAMKDSIGLPHNYRVRADAFDQSSLSFNVTADPDARARNAYLAPPDAPWLTPQTLQDNQQAIAVRSEEVMPTLRELLRDLRTLAPNVQLQLLEQGLLANVADAASIANTVPYYVAQDSIESIVNAEAAGNQRVLVVHSGNAAGDLSAFSGERNPNVVLHQAPSVSSGAALKGLLSRSDLGSFDKILAVGGGSAKDTTAMMVAVGTQHAGLYTDKAQAVRQEMAASGIDLGRRLLKDGVEFVVVPTQLAQTGNTTPFAVLKTHDDGLIVSTPYPARSYLSVPKLIATNERWTPERLLKSFVSGMADYLAGQSFAAAKAVQENTPFTQAVTQHAFDAARVRDWFVANLSSLGQRSSEAVAVLGYAFQEYSLSSQPKLADEHIFFDIADKLRPEGSRQWPSHGEWVAVGTLLNLYVYGKETGNTIPFDNAKRDYRNLGLPVTRRCPTGSCNRRRHDARYAARLSSST